MPLFLTFLIRREAEPGRPAVDFADSSEIKETQSRTSAANGSEELLHAGQLVLYARGDRQGAKGAKTAVGAPSPGETPSSSSSTADGTRAVRPEKLPTS